MVDHKHDEEFYTHYTKSQRERWSAFDTEFKEFMGHQNESLWKERAIQMYIRMSDMHLINAKDNYIFKYFDELGETLLKKFPNDQHVLRTIIERTPTMQSGDPLRVAIKATELLTTSKTQAD